MCACVLLLTNVCDSEIAINAQVSDTTVVLGFANGTAVCTTIVELTQRAVFGPEGDDATAVHMFVCLIVCLIV